MSTNNSTSAFSILEPELEVIHRRRIIRAGHVVRIMAVDHIEATADAPAQRTIIDNIQVHLAAVIVYARWNRKIDFAVRAFERLYDRYTENIANAGQVGVGHPQGQ